MKTHFIWITWKCEIRVFWDTKLKGHSPLNTFPKKSKIYPARINHTLQLTRNSNLLNTDKIPIIVKNKELQKTHFFGGVNVISASS
jgi:hypothetical protein